MSTNNKQSAVQKWEHIFFLNGSAEKIKQLQEDGWEFAWMGTYHSSLGSGHCECFKRPLQEADECPACDGKGSYSVCHDVIDSDDFGGEGFHERAKIEILPCKKCHGTGKRES